MGLVVVPFGSFRTNDSDADHVVEAFGWSVLVCGGILQGGVLVRRSDATHCEDRLTVGRPRNNDIDACTARPGLLRP